MSFSVDVMESDEVLEIMGYAHATFVENKRKRGPYQKVHLPISKPEGLRKDFMFAGKSGQA